MPSDIPFGTSTIRELLVGTQIRAETTMILDSLRACRERMLAPSGLPQTEARLLARRIVLRNGRRELWTLPVRLSQHGFSFSVQTKYGIAVGRAMAVVKPCHEPITWDSAAMAQAPRYP